MYILEINDHVATHILEKVLNKCESFFILHQKLLYPLLLKVTVKKEAVI